MSFARQNMKECQRGLIILVYESGNEIGLGKFHHWHVQMEMKIQKVHYGFRHQVSLFFDHENLDCSLFFFFP